MTDKAINKVDNFFELVTNLSLKLKLKFILENHHWHESQRGCHQRYNFSAAGDHWVD